MDETLICVLCDKRMEREEWSIDDDTDAHMECILKDNDGYCPECMTFDNLENRHCCCYCHEPMIPLTDEKKKEIREQQIEEWKNKSKTTNKIKPIRGGKYIITCLVSMSGGEDFLDEPSKPFIATYLGNGSFQDSKGYHFNSSVVSVKPFKDGFVAQAGEHRSEEPKVGDSNSSEPIKKEVKNDV